MQNPIERLRPEERQRLEQVRGQVGRRIKVQVHKYPPSHLDVRLRAEDQEAEGALATLAEQLLRGILSVLSVLGIEGEVVDH